MKYLLRFFEKYDEDDYDDDPYYDENYPDDYDDDPYYDENYHETYGWYDGNNIFYHGTTDKNLIGTNGIHVGTYQAAKEALEARIGVPAKGEWDGTRKYGETLIAGQNTINKLTKNGYHCGTGFNCAIPKEDYYVSERKTRAKYSDGTEIPLDSYPTIMKVKIIGEMEEEIISDDKANDLGNDSRHHSGYYYKNIGEDSGSISAVVPNKKWLKILKNKT